MFDLQQKCKLQCKPQGKNHYKAEKNCTHKKTIKNVFLPLKYSLNKYFVYFCITK